MTCPHLFLKIFVNFLTSTMLRAQNTTLLSKVRRRFFQILWPSQKTQTLQNLVLALKSAKYDMIFNSFKRVVSFYFSYSGLQHWWAVLHTSKGEPPILKFHFDRNKS